MEADTQAHVAFFLTGRIAAEQLDQVDAASLRPALFAGYRELHLLRHDFPLVLAAGRGGDCVFSLSSLIDNALAATAVGADSERIRKHVLRLETEIRTLADAGGGTLASLWKQAVARLAAADASFTDSAQRARAAIKVDGQVVACDAALPGRLLRHAWASVQEQKAAAFRRTIERLVLKLSDILRADFECSAAGRSAPHLQASVGTGFGKAFDFDAMSTILNRALPAHAFPESRRTRIRELLAVLEAQQFYPPAGDAGEPAYGFVFESCSQALSAFRSRMPKLVELARAITIAELEIDGQYVESKHDALFEQFGANGLDAADLAPFPDYLVVVNAEAMQAAEHTQLMEILSSGLPIKVLLQTDDILEESRQGEGRLAAGIRSRQIAHMAMGLNEVYVLQSASSNLYRCRQRLMHGLTFRGPALFSVFSGASGAPSGIPAYLVAAAAMESRAFPAFSYDPSAGPNWASRFSLDANPQVDLDWPVQGFSYEDATHQRVNQDLAFTLVDFVASDRRYARHLARVPRERWNGSMIAVDESLTRERKGLPDKVPSLMMVDRNNVLQRVIVDERLLREARRCREMWHSLQELGGVHNSHAEKLLARERKAWEERMHAEAEAHVVAVPASPAVVPAAAAPASAAVEEEAPRSRDDAYIETERCSTCNECTQLNPKMFAYNDNKQAYIADLNAGTYAQLVEAAESCQVSVIHPGKPRNAGEPGLDELLKRAEPFR